MVKEFLSLADQANVSDLLRKSSPAKPAIQSLQHALNLLGYGKLLQWERFGADGDFGNSTTAALAEFTRRNNLPFDGDQVSSDIAAAMARLLPLIEDLRVLAKIQQGGSPETILFRRTGSRSSVQALQRILNSLGWGAQLNWERFGADGDYGQSTTDAVKAFGAHAGIATDGNKMTAPLLNHLVQLVADRLGDDWKPAAEATTFSSQQPNQRVMLPAGMKPFKKGIFTVGNRPAKDFLESQPAELASMDITESLQRVMIAVSVNEGNLDAVNTWDNSFMTFGMFQWTIGAGTEKGELPALLKKLKEKAPEVFQNLFGVHGLDVADEQTNSTYGYLRLDGVLVQSLEMKEKLRSNEWAIRFFEAGQDPMVQAVQIVHAADRLKNFYWKDQAAGHLLSDLVTSEFGVALLLDNHVNRPGYVKACVEKAFKRVALPHPSGWGDAEEAKLLDAYLVIRNTHPDDGNPNKPMTDAAKRADRNKRLVEQGKLMTTRGSFVFESTKSRSLLDTSTVPDGYNADLFPEIVEEKSPMPW